MATEPIPLLGGTSVHCITEAQMAEALRLGEKDETSAPVIQHWLARLEETLSRNERAALAFILIQRLKDDPQR